MGLSVHYKETSYVTPEEQRPHLEERLAELAHQLPPGATGCCCVVQKEKGVTLHIVIRASSGCFEASITSKNLMVLSSSLLSHLSPQLKKWREQRNAGKRFERTIPISDPIKREICRKDLCPAIDQHGFWLGGIG